MVGLSAEEQLHSLKDVTAHNRLMAARMPAVVKLDLTEIGSVTKDCMELASGESGLFALVLHPFLRQLRDQAIKRLTVISVELESPPYCRRLHGIHNNQATPFLPMICVAIRSLANEKPIVNPPSESLAYVNALLFGVERGHIGQDAPLHAARRRVLGWLSYIDHWHAVVSFQTFELDIVEQISGGSINFVEQKAIDFGGMLPDKAEQLAERLAFITLARGFRQPIKFLDLAAHPFSERSEGRFLHFERESFPLLLSTRYPGQGYVLLHENGS